MIFVKNLLSNSLLLMKYQKFYSDNKATQDYVLKNGIMLEPRLQEYLKKKQFYKKNNINPNVRLEDEFKITSHDKKILKAFINGKKDIYDYHNKEFNYFKKIRKEKKRYFPSKEFRDDPRLDNIKEIKEKFKKPSNHGMFYPDRNGKYYEDDKIRKVDAILDARDLALNNQIEFNLDDDAKFNPRIDPYIYPNIDPKIEGYDKRQSRYRVVENECNNFIKRPELIYKDKSDIDTKYKIATQLDKERKVYNTEIESILLRGMPNYRVRNRSYGYRNPQENYYQYIDEDIQHHNQILPWPRGGEGTRQLNKTIRKPYIRQIM